MTGVAGRALISLALALFPIRFAEGQAPADEGALAARAQEAIRARDYGSAAGIFQEILKLRPDWAEARANLGLMYHLLGDYERAVAEFQKALQASPDLFAANAACGLDLLELHRPAQALAYLERAHKLNPRDRDAAKGLAHAYVETGRAAAAVAVYDRLTSEDGQDVDAWYALGRAYFDIMLESVRRVGRSRPSVYSDLLACEAYGDRQRWALAAKCYLRIADAPEGARLCVAGRLGFVYLRAGQLTEAERWFRKDRCAAGSVGLGRLEIARGNTKAGMERWLEAWRTNADFVLSNPELLWDGLEPSTIENVVRSVPEFARGLAESADGWRRGSLSFSTADRSAALRSADPTASAEFFYRRARAAHRLALAAFESMRRAEPDSERVHILLGEAYRQQSDWGRARQEYQAALDRSPQNAAARLGLADAYVEELDYAGARPHLEKLLALAPDHPQANLLMARTLAAGRENAAAEACLRKALAGPEAVQIEAHSLLSRIYAEQGRPADAIRELRECLASDKDGRLHYRLYRLYRETGDGRANTALERYRQLRAQARPVEEPAEE